MNDASIEAVFGKWDGERGAFMTRARECAAFTLPDVLPWQWSGLDADIYRPFQSLGSDGTANLVSKLLMALFPTGLPWFGHRPSIRLRASDASPEQLEEFADWLFLRDRLILEHMEAQHYRVAMRSLLEHVLVVGDTVGRITDDYEIQQYRKDHFVLRRNGRGRVRAVITKERVEAEELDDEVLARMAQTREELQKLSDERELWLYTMGERQRDGRWSIRQQILKQTVVESVEPVNPYLTPGYVELPGEHYSRSFIEERIGDLRSFNGLSKAILDAAAIAAKHNPVVDPTKNWVATDLETPNGAVLEGRVTGNVPDGIGYIRVEKSHDMAFALNQSDRIEKRLGKQLLLETAARREGERVTATEVMRTARELDGALGAAYARICGEIQQPYLDRITYQMERDRLLVPLPKPMDPAVDVQILTGMAAIRQTGDLEKLGAAMQLAGQMPGGLERIRFDEVVRQIFKALNLPIDKLLKTDDEIAAEREAALRQQGLVEAQSQAIQSAGSIAETAAKGAA